MWGRKRGVNLVDTPEMYAFIARLDRLNEAQLMAMRAAWSAIDRDEHEVAWAEVRAVGAREGLRKEIGRVRNKAMAWASRGRNTIPYWGDNDNRQRIWLEAEEAIVDAALAVALGDRLDAQTREILMAPWLRVTEGER